MLEARWDIDRPYGEEAENLVRRLLSVSKVEVKRDRRTQDTGNLFIEVSGNRGEPSGVIVTEASHWVYVIDQRDGIENSVAIIIPVQKLKDAVARKQAQGFTTFSSEEGASGYLIPVKELVPCEKAVKGSS